MGCDALPGVAVVEQCPRMRVVIAPAFEHMTSHLCAPVCAAPCFARCLAYTSTAAGCCRRVAMLLEAIWTFLTHKTPTCPQELGHRRGEAHRDHAPGRWASVAVSRFSLAPDQWPEVVIWS